MRRAVRLAFAAAALPAVALAQEVTVLPQVQVLGTAPLPGFTTPLSQIPYNVQPFTARMLAQPTTGIAEFLELNANSVAVSSPSGNDFQPDLSFRGFTASPLLGTPQGLSVFQDGVRINEAFADVVHWDLIPQNAIASMALLPGSNPVFGLNTLGGALSLTMKDGFGFGGANAEAYGGSFGRAFAGADVGGARGPFALFAAGEALYDGGWREHSATRIGRLFTRGDYREGSNEASASVTLADNSLNGTQALPLSMLGNPEQAYTWPDTTVNRLVFVNGIGTHTFSPGLLLTANAYYRQLATGGVNSNVNGDYDPVTSPSQGFNVQSDATTRTWGASLQLGGRHTWGDVPHQWTTGASLDSGTTSFAQSQQDATFVNDREAVGTGPYASQTDVGTRTRYAGVYAADTIALSPAWTVVVSGRYNAAQITTADRTGTNPDIDGTSTFRRFNPAVGATWQASEAVNLFGNVSQGMRVPTPVELTCADPDAPCTLPNIFVADPPLAAVTATTYEFGARGKLGERAFYSAALYRACLRNDIQFIGAGTGAVNAGYFANVGNTRRQGIELTAGTGIGEFSFVARYSLLDATFQSAFSESSPNNSSANAEGVIDVQPGDRIPGLPRNTFRLRADWARGPFSAGLTLLAVSSQYARGDENNRDVNGPVPGYTVVSLDGTWRLDRDWQVYARIENLFDRTYQNFGILGANYFRGPGNTFDAALATSEQFRSPGAPFGIWVGVRYRLDRV
jgi:outer membrane receptor protein involved in Fe transport